MKSQSSIVATFPTTLCCWNFRAAAEGCSLPEPDDRYKADFLLLITHPDDGLTSGYLAKAILDERKRGAGGG